MSDFLPVEHDVALADLQRIDQAAKLGIVPKGRERMLHRTTLRPGIVPDNLPTKGPAQKSWPKTVARSHGVFISRFEDFRTDWVQTYLGRSVNGAPNAYHPFNQHALRGIEEQQAWGFTALVKREGELVRQGAGDPCPGHLVCRTAYRVPGFEDVNPARYLNANVVSYISVPLALMLNWRDDWPIVIGCSALVWDRSRNCQVFAVVGDVDLHGGGAVSEKLWVSRMGFANRQSVDGIFQFTIFPGHAAEGYELQRWTPTN